MGQPTVVHRARGRHGADREEPRAGPPSAPSGRPGSLALSPLAGLATVGVVVPAVLAWTGGDLGGVTADLGTAAYDLTLSFTRMLFAYLMALGFALTYGYFAASYRSGERVLIPILDILQSVPILGFFPVAILFFVNLTGPGSWIGPNMASIFLIFTSMAWNMVFGVYESLKSLPAELKEAADSFGVRGSQRLREVLAPATVNRLVYNSVLSWTAGWYFLVAAEFISTSSSTTALPGIGSYLLGAAGTGNGDALIAGIVLLIALIALLDVAVWRPAGRWAEKYRYDQAPSGGTEELTGGPRSRTAPLRRAAGYVYRGVRTGVTRIRTPFVGLATLAVGAEWGRARRPYVRSVFRYLALGALLVLAWLLLITIGVGVYGAFASPIDPTVRGQIGMVPLALAASFGRILAAYLASLAIALPLAIFLVRRPKVYRLGLPTVEVVASVPATALFPLFIFALLPYIGFQGAAILMLITGMMWYLFFNVLSGLRSIPPDLDEAARSFGLPRREYYRRLVLPAIFPALITGSITAFGGGWNTLIVAEYLQYGPAYQFQVLGIGELIDVANYLDPGRTGLPLMAAALFTMVATVIAVNELLWKPLYRRAVEKYRYD